MRSFRTARLTTAGLLFGALALTGTYGCTEIDDGPQDPGRYEPQTSEDNVINNLQVAYRQRQIGKYAELLASDFQFYFDPKTRGQLGIEFWSRTTDSLQTEVLFNSSDVTSIKIELTWPKRSASGAGYLTPREGWTKLFLTDVFLDVDVQTPGQPVTTLRVEDQTQRFYFRKGRTYPPSGPADTLMYLVEWRDEGDPDAPGSVSGLKAN
ncbi:MAG TPA: hypothetical protein VF720_04545 [Candidatus Eisenbacteria bacterium]